MTAKIIFLFRVMPGLLLVNTDPIHNHDLRERSRHSACGIDSGEHAAHGDVQDEYRRAGGTRPWNPDRMSTVLYSSLSDFPAHVVVVPFHFIDVEILGKRIVQDLGSAVLDMLIVGVTSDRFQKTMRSPSPPPRSSIDVDLAALRPVHRRKVGAQHPESGPHARAVRHADARATIFPYLTRTC